MNFHYPFGRYVHHISAGNNFSVTLCHNGVKRISFDLSPTFISNSSMSKSGKVLV